MIATHTLPLDNARDFFFSAAVNKLGVMSRGLLTEAEKQKLSDMFDGLKGFLMNPRAFEDALNADQLTRKSVIAGHTKASDETVSQIHVLLGKTITPSQNLLVRNRFVVLLDDLIQSLEDKPLLKETLGWAAIYFYDDTVNAKTINEAVDISLGSMNARYHAAYLPKRDHVVEILTSLHTQALDAQAQNPNERIIRDPYSAERLAAMRLNL